jgi:acyl carrier protein
MISMPSRSDILEELAEILERDLGVQYSSAISEETRFFADLGLASIDAVVLSEKLREHYRQPLPFDLLMAEIGRRIDRDLTIGELIAFLRSNLSAN